ncbi:ABC transporter substrate binding protein [Clostridium sp. 1001271B_151109_B4]|uniref:sensor histidine kinase n=1 Tax=Clostridium sp. 1001271B_151109_B4 TaxID=2787148 RepID=UPI0018AC3AC3|nr:ABC transporter substrate binding protein [Clostridium sp. 1001271B_151109_B4]
MGKLKRGIYVAIILFTIVVTIIESKTYDVRATNNKLNILFISSYDFNFISFDDQISGIKDALNNNVNLRIEYLDSEVIRNEKSIENFYNVIKYTIENYENFDAVITGDDEALQFALKYREDLFKGIPISFLGVEKESLLEKALEYSMVSGVREMESISENLELIKNNHPNVNNIVFVNDSGNNFYPDIVKEYSNFNFSSIITEDISQEEFQDIISKLQDDTAIISLYPDEFKGEKVLSYLEVNKIISEYANDVPIYNILEYGIGTGSIGGKVVDHYKQGKLAGQIVIKLLQGEEPLSIFIDDDSANSYVFDYSVLKKYNISKKSLPKNSVIINDPSDIIKQYKFEISLVIEFIIFLIFIVCILIKYIFSKRKYEKRILKAMEEAEEGNKIKSHFIANISHEVRTPVNVILSAVQLLEVNKTTDQNKLTIIKNNCFRLIRLINNVIDVRKVELEDVKLKLVHINIVNFIESLVNSILPYAEHKNLSVIFDTNEEDIIMKVDANKIERTILNLLSNAIKFSNENGIIKVNLEFTEELLRIVIEDNGIGINPEDKERIFDKFVQVDKSLTRNNEGCGIGLTISKSFVELHKGVIKVTSEINKGTKFIVELPKFEMDKESDQLIKLKESKLKEEAEIEFSDIYIS